MICRFDIYTCYEIYSYEHISESNLPIVNLRDPGVSFKLLSALEDWGFSYVTGHDISMDIIDDAFQKNKIFFDLPMRVKRQVDANRKLALKTSRGYTPFKAEQLDVSSKGKPDLKEVFDIGYVDRSTGNNAQHYLGKNKWPKRPIVSRPNVRRPNIRRQNVQQSQKFRGKRDVGKEIKNTIETYASQVSKLAKTILQLTFNELDCGKEFEEMFGPDSLQIQRLTRYPAFNDLSEIEHGQIGAGIHSDYGGITILSAEGTGLSVLKLNRSSEYTDKGTFSDELEVPNSKDWIEVPSINGTFIVMAGEALQRLSNGRIYAVKHKVELLQEKPRYSLAFFYDPNPEAILAPLNCARKSGSPLYNAKIAGHKGVIKKVTSHLGYQHPNWYESNMI